MICVKYNMEYGTVLKQKASLSSNWWFPGKVIISRFFIKYVLQTVREGLKKRKKWEFSHSGEGPPPFPPNSGEKCQKFPLF